MGDEMSFAPRMKQILNVMLKADKPISAKILAESIGISKRTVQRELDYLDTALRKYPIAFRRKTGVGMWLEGTPEDKKRLAAQLANGDDYDVSNREDRRKRLLLAVLKDKEPKKLFYYSTEFGVSEATISNDLEAIEDWLKEYQLSIIRKPGSGIVIDGTEENYRRAIRDFINENMDTQAIREFYENIHPDQEIQHLKESGLGKVLNEDIVTRVVSAIRGIDDDRILTLTENSYVGLVLHVSIAINRILKGEIIEKNVELIASMDRDADFELAGNIVDELEAEFDIQIPPMEIFYICLHIKGAKHQKIDLNQGGGLNIGKNDLKEMLNEMIDTFDFQKAFYLKQDDEFIQGLLAHLQPTIIRIVYGMQIQNPILEDIKENYAEIFEKCIKVSKVLENWLGKTVPEAETGFLTVHFGAAMVRMEDKKETLRKVSVGIVCASGIGISRLMASKVERYFKDRVMIKTYGQNDITEYIGKNTDFFVTSISIDRKELDVLEVSPLLNEKDMEKMEQKVFFYERSPKVEQAEDIDTKFTAQLEEVNFIASQIKIIIRYFDLFEVPSAISFPKLVETIGKNMAHYSDWEKAIEEDIMKREKLGTQVFAEFGFALLHTRTQGVIRPGIAVYVTKDRKEFSDDYFHGISIVIVMLLPVDDHIRENSDIVGYISSTLIEDYAFLDLLFTADKEEMREAFSRCLKKYFNQYLTKF